MEVDPGQREAAAWALRFGLQQKEKVRVIDDFSIVGINQTAGISEYIKIFGIDSIEVFRDYSLDVCGEKTYLSLFGKNHRLAKYI